MSKLLLEVALFYNETDCWDCLPGQATSEVETDVQQTLFWLGISKLS